MWQSASHLLACTYWYYSYCYDYCWLLHADRTDSTTMEPARDKLPDDTTGGLRILRIHTDEWRATWSRRELVHMTGCRPPFARCLGRTRRGQHGLVVGVAVAVAASPARRSV